MKFKSTRGEISNSFLQAFNTGLASDGGLFVPEQYPNIQDKLNHFSTLSYPELVSEFFSLFDDEISKEEWLKLATSAYTNFDSEDKISLVNISPEIHILELFHGPTLAFKDFALQFVGKLYERETKLNNKKYTILGATSGDTGSAAIYGVLDNLNINIFILYPDGNISPMQELQITTTESRHVFPISIEGSFDDAQSIVKDLFSDKEFRDKINLRAVNSINIARILAQSVYYLFTYLKLTKEGSAKPIRFIVPTGNFGNILSGWILAKMGLDFSFVLSTNENDVLHTLWETGIYEKKSAKVTSAPSMDIQQASNFERILYYMYDEDPTKVKEILKELKDRSRVTIDYSKIPKNISSTRTNNAEINDCIKSFYSKYNYVLDPHTACATKGINNKYTNIILATAAPAKFPEIINECINITPTHPRLEILKSKSRIREKLPADKNAIKSYILSRVNSD